jgi:hypothetical protein
MKARKLYTQLNAPRCEINNMRRKLKDRDTLLRGDEIQEWQKEISRVAEMLEQIIELLDNSL